MRPTAWLVLSLALLPQCTASRGSPSDAGPAASIARPRYGAVMTEIGRRFELAGRAAKAKRFELAAFEVGELEEAFDDELPSAKLPKEGPTASLPAMAEAFAKTHPAALATAARAEDGPAFAEAFRQASATCNACHEASGHAFIKVPAAPGMSVPDLEPIAAP